MKNYKLILILGVFYFSACSQKDESLESTSTQDVVVPQAIVHKISLKQTPKNETISNDYVETVEEALKKMETSDEVKKIENISTVPSIVASVSRVTVPEHIKNSTIESVPR